MSGAGARLDFDAVTLRFGGLLALRDVSFAVEPGELVAVIGPNGSGKTSLLNCVSGLYVPASGRVLLDGVPIVGSRWRSADLGIGRTLQNLGLFDGLTVLENVLVGRHRHMRAGVLAGALWLGRAAREERVQRAVCAEILERLGLLDHAATAVSSLPYGLRKRVELARALAMEPRLLLLDEPVAGMTAHEAAEMADGLRALRARSPLTIVLVEHDMPFVMGLAERVVVLESGCVIAAGTPAQVQRDERVVRAYLGEEVPA